MPTQNIDFSAVGSAAFNGTELSAINLNGSEIWSSGGGGLLEVAYRNVVAGFKPKLTELKTVTAGNEALTNQQSWKFLSFDSDNNTSTYDTTSIVRLSNLFGQVFIGNSGVPGVINIYHANAQISDVLFEGHPAETPTFKRHMTGPENVTASHGDFVGRYLPSMDPAVGYEREVYRTFGNLSTYSHPIVMADDLDVSSNPNPHCAQFNRFGHPFYDDIVNGDMMGTFIDSDTVTNYGTLAKIGTDGNLIGIDSFRSTYVAANVNQYTGATTPAFWQCRYAAVRNNKLYFPVEYMNF